MFKPGALLLVPFPFSDLSSSRVRHAHHLANRCAWRTLLFLGIGNIDAGALPVASWVRIDRVVTLNASLIIKSFAKVKQGVLSASHDALCHFIEQQQSA